MKILLALAVLLTGCTEPAVGKPAAVADPAVVETASGAVRGTVTSANRLFQGIKYATAARWEAPKPVPAWQGVREATKPGALCPQVGTPYAPTSSDNEDCLFLNVTTPAVPGRGRPVMVWIHGDGAVGAGHFSDARKLAAKGVVVVTINYRLGVFSGFGYPGLPDSGTFGLQDQQEALRWVKRNAAAFGGDPGNVTAFGISYGALSIGGQLSSPGARGLFQRAIMQSGETLMDMPANSMVPGVPALPSFAWRPAAEVSAIGEVYAEQLGCADLACLRALPVKKILEVPQIMNVFQSYAYGNDVLPESPADAMRKGHTSPIPVLAGTTRDEHRIFVGMNYDVQGTSPVYRQLLKDAFGAKAEKIARKYPVNHYKSPSIAWATVLTDRMWARSTHEQNALLAKKAPVYGYEFADRKAPMFLPLEADFDWGAYHASDLPYIFPETKAELSPAQERLSGQMMSYWTNFARTGDPNGRGLPAWPRVSSGTLSLAPGAVRPVDYAAEHQLAFWK